jgi:hypothetical protein
MDGVADGVLPPTFFKRQGDYRSVAPLPEITCGADLSH